jgi:hypothetical protein
VPRAPRSSGGETGDTPLDCLSHFEARLVLRNVVFCTAERNEPQIVRVQYTDASLNDRMEMVHPRQEALRF